MSTRISKRPSSWVKKKLRELIQPRETTNPAKRVGGTFQYVDIEALDNTRQLITSPKKLDINATPSRARIAIRKGDVIFSLVRPYLKNIAVVPEDLDGEVASTAFCQLRPNADIDKWFLFYQLIQDSFIHSIPTYGTSPPAARDEEFLELAVVAPPIEEQTRAVSKIEELFSDLDAGVAALERARAKLKRYRASVLKAAVEGRLTEKWRAEQKAKGVAVEPAAKLLERVLTERRKKWEATQLKKYADTGNTAPRGWQSKYPAPAEPEVDNLSQIPDGWCWSSLSQVGFLDRGRSKHRPRNAPHLLGGPYPFIQTGEIRRATGVLRAFNQTYSEAGLAQSKLWPKGTLCITIAANIAETAILDFDACFPDSVVGFLPGSDLISVHFVELYIRTLQSRLEKMAPATAQKNMNLETLVQVPVCVPSYKEQVEIVSQVDAALTSITHAESEIEHSLARAARLRQAILKRAFEGRLV